MAGALGLDPSMGAMVQAANMAYKFSKELYKFSRDTGAARREIESFANTAWTFADVVMTAKISLREHWRNHGDSKALAHIAHHNVLNGVRVESDDVRRLVAAAARRIRSRIKSRYPFITFVRWTFQKDSIIELFPAMERIKTSLQLILSILTYEIMNSKIMRQASTGQYGSNDDTDDAADLYVALNIN